MLKRGDFPPGFVFGAATAAYQIEGHAQGGAGPCHWDTFSQGPGNVLRAENGAIACDHYNRWPEDLDLVQAAGFDAYRFSTSWARVMPDGETVNPEGLDFYDRLVDGMVERGIKPSLTLYHWDLPVALADHGGWVNRRTAECFARYADCVVTRLGDRVEAVATVNEPWCVSWLSHFEGHHAPGLRDIRAAARSMHHIQLAHGLALERIKDRARTGIVLNFAAIEPATPNDSAAARRMQGICNDWFIQSIMQGSYPDIVLVGLEPHMPDEWQDDMARISAPIDWLGVNYYTRNIFAEDFDAPWPSAKAVDGPRDKTQMGWEVYPEGLTQTLTWLAREYTGDLPLIVTENGMAWDDKIVDGAINDVERTNFIAQHLSAVRAAIDAGAPVEGFFYWSLLDNYEWALGYERRFGIVHVDYDTLQRKPKQSYYALARALSRTD